ncbi:MAG: hypothetical protein A3B68_09650 [Candidatus Melainabacteria bacterium RIFCSPHIGHO2_02_FULL_34_12]|nr:MAG: hypothetical protein A3B68_09650 [Candidatus Melainabacteria bacterium RIFCSPHIGHO2_02_FULL_34_12]
MKKKILSLILVLLMFGLQSINIKAKAGTAQVPLNITVNGSLVITDADNDNMSGVDPTRSVTIQVTPDLLQSQVTGGINFRIRTNKTAWRLTTNRTASNAGGTGLIDSDISVTIAKSAGTTGNLNAGTIVSPFNAATNLTSIPTSGSKDVISGTARTSSAKDSTNQNNYFQVNTLYGVAPDFFYTPGTFSTIITYNLVAP